MNNGEIFDALRALEKERGIPVDYMVDKIKTALINAYKRDQDENRDTVMESVSAVLTEKEMRLYARKQVVEEVLDPAVEIDLLSAQKIDRHAAIDDFVDVNVKVENFSRIAAQTAKQVIIQGIREAERGMVFESFSSKSQEMLTGTVLRIDPNAGDMIIRLGQGTDRTDALLARSEQIPGERYKEGDLIRVYVVDVRRSNRGPQVMVSRTHPNLVRRLFELEVPEISDGLVEIRNIAREAGSRSKMAVSTTQDNIDPVGACVGPKGARVGAVVDELKGEKMDIIVWSEDPCKYVAAALAPADVISVSLVPGTKACRVVVPDDQLSLAIGKEGQNARLAARLTGYKIDIKPASQVKPEEAEPEEAEPEDAEDQVEEAVSEAAEAE